MEAEAEGGNNSLMSTITNRSLLSIKGPRGCTITFKFIRVDQCMHANRRLVHSSNRTVPLTIMETRVHKDEIWQAHCTWPRLTHRIKELEIFKRELSRVTEEKNYVWIFKTWSMSINLRDKSIQKNLSTDFQFTKFYWFPLRMRESATI